MLTQHQMCARQPGEQKNYGAPECSSEDSSGIDRRRVVMAFSVCVLYIIVSSSMIRAQKYMMSPKHFPFPMALVTMHMMASTVLSSFLYLIKPSFFPGMTMLEGRKLEVLRLMIPIACAFCTALVFSNKAYEYSNVTFLQFMKEGNVILTFVLSCMVGLQVLNRVRVFVILWVLLGAFLTLSGEVHFVMTGLLLQLVSQLGDVSRAVMGELVMTGREFKLDPMTYTLVMTPICLGLLLLGTALWWDPVIPHKVIEYWPVLLPNCFLAFLLNLIVAVVITETSAVGFVFAGFVKDIALVVLSACVFGEIVTRQQSLGFVVILSGVCFWSLMKVSPHQPMVVRVERLLGMPQPKLEDADETSPILPTKP